MCAILITILSVHDAHHHSRLYTLVESHFLLDNANIDTSTFKYVQKRMNARSMHAELPFG